MLRVKEFHRYVFWVKGDDDDDNDDSNKSQTNRKARVIQVHVALRRVLYKCIPMVLFYLWLNFSDSANIILNIFHKFLRYVEQSEWKTTLILLERRKDMNAAALPE